MTAASVPQLVPKHVFGVKADVKNNFWFLKEDAKDSNYLYAAGDLIVSYFSNQRTQQFIQPTEKSMGITAITCSSSRRYVAVAERAERAIISVYDPASLKKKRVLPAAPECSSQVCFDFLLFVCNILLGICQSVLLGGSQNVAGAWRWPRLEAYLLELGSHESSCGDSCFTHWSTRNSMLVQSGR